MTSSISANKKKQAIRLLAIDVGNTSTLFVLFSGSRIKKSLRLATPDVSKKSLALLSKLGSVDVAVVASVVPDAGDYLEKMISRRLKIKTYQIGKNLAAPIKNRYKNPKQVGADRLVNAVAAHEIYKRDVIIIDFGTAITFDVVSKKGEYLGGVIAPGIEISIEALFQKTALLPKIRLKHPSGIIGRNTVESIQAGCSFGIGGLCDRIVAEITRRQGLKPLVIATGGYAVFMSKYCHSIQKIDENLTIQGIRLTYQKSLDKSS